MGREPKRERWPGGYIHRETDGTPLFIIEKQVDGERFHISTRCHSWKPALEQYERFQADPLGYSPAGATRDAPLRLTAELTGEFYEFQLARVSRKWARDCNRIMADWTEALAGVDLRRATLRDHIKPGLERYRGGRPARIEVIKRFYSWLRKERHLLTHAQDPTLDLPVPQARPEKWRRRKAVPFASVQKVARKLSGAYRDVVVVLAATGWHVTELERFIRDERSELLLRGRSRATLITKHKGGEPTRTPVTNAGAVAAASRLRAAREVPRRLNDAIKSACDAAGVPRFTAGVFRHSVATWSIERGAVPALVSEFLGHKDARTTRRFYSDVAVPTAPVKLPALRLVR